MTLKLYLHPLSSFCQKVIMAFYENGTPFETELVSASDPSVHERLLSLWPVGAMPLLRDEARDQTIPESTIIIEYLAQHYPGKTLLVPADADLARETRLRDRFYDLYVHHPMQKIMGDVRRPDGSKDPAGVADAEQMIATAYAMIDKEMATRTWAMGEAFTMVDCAAAPALFYGRRAAPFDADHTHLAAYLDRLMNRPCYARAVEEAKPYFHMLPK